MLGEFITRGLILILGYAYPAFECFKTMEKNRVEMHELRFWCQYWIIVAVLTVFERVVDMFINWLPMYGEMKLALIIYLWYPKTKGTGYVYETLLRPYVSLREPYIDRSLRELHARAWDLALYYWQNCTSLGQTKFFEIVQFISAQFGKVTKANNELTNICKSWLTSLNRRTEGTTTHLQLLLSLLPAPGPHSAYFQDNASNPPTTTGGRQCRHPRAVYTGELDSVVNNRLNGTKAQIPTIQRIPLKNCRNR